MALWQGALADFSIKKYPSTIRWENGVLISHFCAYFLENFLALTIRWKKRVLIPPFALKNCRKFCPLLYAGKTGFLHPPPAHIFQKIFISHYTLKKSPFGNPIFAKLFQKKTKTRRERIRVSKLSRSRPRKIFIGQNTVTITNCQKQTNNFYSNYSVFRLTFLKCRCILSSKVNIPFKCLWMW